MTTTIQLDLASLWILRCQHIQVCKMNKVIFIVVTMSILNLQDIANGHIAIRAYDGSAEEDKNPHYHSAKKFN